MSADKHVRCLLQRSFPCCARSCVQQSAQWVKCAVHENSDCSEIQARSTAPVLCLCALLAGALWGLGLVCQSGVVGVGCLLRTGNSVHAYKWGDPTCKQYFRSTHGTQCMLRRSWLTPHPPTPTQPPSVPYTHTIQGRAAIGPQLAPANRHTIKAVNNHKGAVLLNVNLVTIV